MVAGALVSAFSWIFVTRSEREQVRETIVEDLLWRWFVIPLQQDLVPVVDRQGGGLVLPRGYCPPSPPGSGVGCRPGRSGDEPVLGTEC